MATITDQTYFVRERSVPTVAGEVGMPTLATTEANAKLNDFIAFYEPEFIKLIIGETLYPDYIASREVDGSIWKTFDAYLFNTDTKDSCVADYIFCKYWKDADTIVGDGTHLLNGDNPTRVSYMNRTLPVYNRMIDLVVKAVTFLADSYITYFPNNEYDCAGWGQFVWTDGYKFKPSYDNAFGL